MRTAAPDRRPQLASRLGHLPTATNPYIRERLQRYRQPEDTFDPAIIQARITVADDLGQIRSPAIRYVVAVDGSGHEDEEAFDYYPSTRVLYMQIAGVFIDLQLMLDQPGRFVDPARIADATESSVVSGFLPGSFLEYEDYKDPAEAFRAELFDLFASTLFDGDLAVFGEAARLHRGLLGAWQALASRCSTRSQQPPVLLGVAKTGYPVEHLHGIRRFLPSRHLMRLDDYYMRERLRVRSLSDTYFGRKFYYHVADGQMLVLTVPPAEGDAYAKPASQRTPDSQDTSGDLSSLARFPTLARTFDVLDRLGSRLFDDVLIPASLAHNWAAYQLANVADR